MSLLLAVQGGGGSGTSYTLTGLAGSYSLAGGTASLNVARQITANAGTYSLTGGTAVLKVGRQITANAGSYSLTGGSATLTKTTGSVSYTLTGLAGSYSLTGGNAELTLTSATTGGGSYDEPRKRKYVVKVGDKLLVFASETQAKRALDLQDKPKQAKKVEKKAAEVVPVATVANFIEKQRIDYLLIQKQLDQLMYEYEMARDEQDLEDILALL